MRCFNCNSEIKKSFADYHLHDRNAEGTLYQNEFKKFFPNLKLFNCEQCGIISIDHYAINKESLDILRKIYSKLSMIVTQILAPTSVIKL